MTRGPGTCSLCLPLECIGIDHLDSPPLDEGGRWVDMRSTESPSTDQKVHSTSLLGRKGLKQCWFVAEQVRNRNG